MAIDKAVDSAKLDAKFSAIADALRAADGSAEAIAPEQMPEKVEGVFAAGAKSEHDRFWDEYQQNGERIDYNNAFSGDGWTDALYSSKKYPIPETVTSAYMMFRLSHITDLSDINIVANNLQYFCSYSPVVKVGSVYGSSTANGCFAGCTGLKTVGGFGCQTTAPMGAFDAAFSTCTALEDLTIIGEIGLNQFDVHWSTKLTHDSLMSIINALQDKSADTSGTAWKITLGDANLAKLSEEEISIAEEKGWVLA